MSFGVPAALRAAPFLVLAVHMAMYGAWIVDDAAITFAYARNAVDGYGVVAYPGDPPVEGFTNLLWLVLVAAPMTVGLFDPVWTPKLLAFACAAGAFVALRRAAGRTHPEQLMAADVGLLLVAANPSFAIWCASGLENALFALLVALLVERAAAAVNVGATVGSAVRAGVLALLVAITRPDGVAFAALWPAVWIAGRLPAGARLRLAAWAAGTTVVGIALVTLWRWRTFGDVVPNTFHAKGSGTVELAAWAALYAGSLIATLVVGRWLAARHAVAAVVGVALVSGAVLRLSPGGGLLRAFGSEAGIVAMALAFAGAARASAPPAAVVWALASILSLFVFMALPTDWMDEFRFGTPFFAVATPWAALELAGWLRVVPGLVARRLLTSAVTAILAVVLVLNGQRAARFRAAPTIAMATVEAAFRATFTRWAEDLDIEGPTVLQVAAGGSLWARTVRLLDLGGLCHREIAPLLNGRRDELRALILDRLRPTFIEIHGPGAHASGLPGDARFAADYVAIEEWYDDRLSELAGAQLRGGRYVRRDAAPPADVLRKWAGERR